LLESVDKNCPQIFFALDLRKNGRFIVNLSSEMRFSLEILFGFEDKTVNDFNSKNEEYEFQMEL